jgi:Holliday junction DNA helicase RuvB
MSENFKKSLNKHDKAFEMTLRPNSLKEFFGQEKLHKQLNILITAAQKRKEPLGHCLFSGPPGLGKTTLANIISKSTNSNLLSTSGPVLEKPRDLAGILTNLKKGDILFIDEIHRIPKCIEEYLYPAMEDFSLDLLIDTGPNARSVKIKLNRFTLIGATTKSGLISNPMRSRFNFSARLDYYEPETLKSIIKRSSKILQVNLKDCGASEIAKRSRGTPRIANNLLRWVRDYAQTNSINEIDSKLAKEALEMLSIDNLGLNDMDKKILSVIMNHYNGGPVGLKTIAVSVGENETTIEDVHEPFLITLGFLKRTPRGREVTKLTYKHMGKNAKKQGACP